VPGLHATTSPPGPVRGEGQRASAGTGAAGDAAGCLSPSWSVGTSRVSFAVAAETAATSAITAVNPAVTTQPPSCTPPRPVTMVGASASSGFLSFHDLAGDAVDAAFPDAVVACP
jgi:hypothetical protein